MQWKLSKRVMIQDAWMKEDEEEISRENDLRYRSTEQPLFMIMAHLTTYFEMTHVQNRDANINCQ